MSRSFVSKADYEEPCCPLSKPTDVHPIPIGRIIGRLDEYLSRDDYVSAERHIEYWLEEADACGDNRGKLSLLNERIGLSRKMGKREKCLASINAVLALAERENMDGTVTMGTTLVNAATGYKAFGMADRALPLYRKAMEIYESTLSSSDGRLGGLYNNMALALTDLAEFDEAEELYKKALGIMANVEHGEAEIAITYCNLADLAAAKYGTEEAEETIRGYLEKAEKFINNPSLPRDGYHAFVCEKCAPTFGYYGFFLTENELLKRAREIYERT